MGRHLVYKIVVFIFSLGLLIALSFFFLRFIPGGPFDDQNFSGEVLKNLQEHYRIHSSFWQQLMHFFKSVLVFDFGPSLSYPGKTVILVVLEKSLVTLKLGFFALVLTLLFSSVLALGSLSRRLGTIFDLLQIVLVSTPILLMGPLTIWFFGFHLNWLPIQFQGDGQSLLLPVFLIALRPTGTLSQVLSQSLREIARQPWARTQRGFGISEVRLHFKYALRLALVPCLGLASPLISHFLLGSFLVETLFSIQGLGFAFLNSILSRDFILTTVLILFFGLILQVCNWTADRVIERLDPRIVL